MKNYLKKIIIKKEISTKDFLKFMPVNQKRGLLKLASDLKGKKVVHINATAKGGGVDEILRSLVPYLRSLGIKSDWYVINPKVSETFFETTNKIHNALQGAQIKISSKEWAEYESVNKSIAKELDKIDYDVLVVNDPQPLLSGYYSRLNKKKIYYSHIDTSSVYKPVWKKLFPYIESYEKIVFSNSDFVNKDLSKSKINIFTPAIDPLSIKQKIVSKREARSYLKEYGNIPTTCPLIVQVSRFDVWKNPFGVIDAFKLLQKSYPKACLALVGFNQAKDNPASAKVYKQVEEAVKDLENVFLFFYPKDINVSEFTSMAQNGADVIVQNSIKEGFGLVVSEAMWKSKPVVGGPASGVRKQIKNGKNGFIVKNPKELSNKIKLFLSNSEKRKIFGREAKKTVSNNFLFPRLVSDHLRLYKSCLK